MSAAARICRAMGWSLDEIALGENVSAMSSRGFAESRQTEFQGLDLSDVVEIPVLSVKASAGPGTWNARTEVIERMPFSRSHLRALGVEPKNVHGIHSAGDSMWPTIADNALLLVDTAKREIVGDYIWSLVVGDEARIKRIQRLMDGSLSLISDNHERYLPEKLERADLERVEIIGRVFWTERML